MTFIYKIIPLFIQQIFTESYYGPKLLHVVRLDLKVVYTVSSISMDNYLMNDIL